MTTVTETEKIFSVVPYNADADPIAYQRLPWIWKRLLDDDLVKHYFSGTGKFTFSQLVRYFSDPSNLAALITIGKGDDAKLMGFVVVSGVVENLGKKTAIMTFGFFREFWDGETTHAAGKEVMRIAFNDLGIDSLVGLVARENKAAAKFLKKLGWECTGSIPHSQEWEGVSCDGDIWLAHKPLIKEV